MLVLCVCILRRDGHPASLSFLGSACMDYGRSAVSEDEAMSGLW